MGAKELTALPELLDGGESVLCPPALDYQALLLASPNTFPELRLCCIHLLTVMMLFRVVFVQVALCCCLSNNYCLLCYQFLSQMPKLYDVLLLFVT